MSNMETGGMEVARAMEGAEQRVNQSQEDISAEQNRLIKVQETDIAQKLIDFQQEGLYEEVKSAYADLQINPNETPKDTLKRMAANFDQVTAQESQNGTDQLQALTRDTLNAMSLLKQELGDSAMEARRFEQKKVEQFASMLPEQTFDASNVYESIRTLAEKTGRPTNVDRIEQISSENETLLTLARTPTNHKKYQAANQEFALITGLRMEDVGKKIEQGLAKANALLTVNGEEAKKTFDTAVRSAMELMGTTNDILTNALFNTAYKGIEIAQTATEAVADTVSDAMLYTEEEMALVLEALVRGTGKDESWLGQVLNVDDAYMTLFNRGESERWGSEKIALSAIKGGTEAIKGFAHLVGHPGQTLAHLASSAKGLLKPSTYAKLTQLTGAAWDKTNRVEKMQLVTQLVVEMGAGGAVMGGVLKAGKLANIGDKMTRFSRATGMVRATEMIATTMNTGLKNFATLGRYGSTGTQIVEGMGERAATLIKKAEHLSHHAEHTVHQAHKVLEKAEATDRRTTRPVEEMKKVKEEVELALTQAASTLNLTPEQMNQLKQTAQKLETTITQLG